MAKQELLSLKINQKKLKKFQQLCQQNNINESDFFHRVIDACLTENNLMQSLINDNNDNNDNLETQINLILEKSLQPLIKRIELLENKSDHELKNTDYLSSAKENNLTDEQEIEEDKITYLPRNQVWQKLKQTDYINYSGYDDFLKANKDEFIAYGIFFDSQKKRFYIFNEEE